MVLVSYFNIYVKILIKLVWCLRFFFPVIKVHQKHNELKNHLLQSNSLFSFHHTTTSLFSSQHKRIVEGLNYSWPCSKPLYELLIVCDGGSPLPGLHLLSCREGLPCSWAESSVACAGRSKLQGCLGWQLWLPLGVGAWPLWQPKLLLTHKACPKRAAAIGLKARRYGTLGSGPQVSISQSKTCMGRLIGRLMGRLIEGFQISSRYLDLRHLVWLPLSFLPSYHLLLKILSHHWSFFCSQYFYKASFHPFFSCLLNFSVL